jgi:DNA (cytosine-5)-methyltransferase 1
MNGRRRLTTVSLFSGIGGLDLGLQRAGAVVREMCESWQPARRVLDVRFPGVSVHDDVAHFEPGPDYDVLTAGFPCTDLSHAGGKAGIFGPQSGLVEHAFRIAGATRPDWIVIENVPNLLLLHSGAGISYIVDQLESLGYSWAYRTVDSRFTGVPQRRFRVILLASISGSPGARLFNEPTDAADPNHDDALAPGKTLSDGANQTATNRSAGRLRSTPAGIAAGPRRAAGSYGRQPHGFYWTEGRNGLGLVAGAVPTLKGGSTLGTPSAPAVWFPDAPRGRRFVLPSIEDAEVLQGLPRGWTSPAVDPDGPDLRWKLVGNAVTTGVGEWIGRRLTAPGEAQPVTGRVLERETPWPRAALGGPGRPAVEVDVSDRPVNVPMMSLTDVIDVMTATPLSHRATKGFLSRFDEKPRPDKNEAWYADLEGHLSSTMPPGLPEKAESWASSDGSRARMRRQKQKDTKPELAMRRELSSLGLRYRLQVRPERDLRSRLDIVFLGAKVAVDIRGCFWHSCPMHGTKPKLNADRWAEKLRRNRERDAETVRALEERGWVVWVVWEHDDPVEKAKEVAVLVEHRRVRGPGRTKAAAPAAAGRDAGLTRASEVTE